MTAGTQDSGDRRSGDKKALAGQLGIDRKAGTGQPDRAVGIVQHGQEREDRTART
jgi:hypothetical protein